MAIPPPGQRIQLIRKPGTMQADPTYSHKQGIILIIPQKLTNKINNLILQPMKAKGHAYGSQSKKNIPHSVAKMKKTIICQLILIKKIILILKHLNARKTMVPTIFKSLYGIEIRLGIPHHKMSLVFLFENNLPLRYFSTLCCNHRSAICLEVLVSAPN